MTKLNPRRQKNKIVNPLKRKRYLTPQKQKKKQKQKQKQKQKKEKENIL
jgi:hypothetical protein